ncbi:MAG TPA: ankyrin repeat domain-containing protein [Actinomycetota bacterium]|nr:ankyrin repeat domain-containing protein [Actinomycetota bacterium]
MGELVDAVQAGNRERVFELISDRRVADERDESGVSAVMHALYRGQEEVARAIAEAKGWLDAFEAAAIGDAGKLELALKENPEQLNAWSPDGFTPLHFAAFFGRRLAANILLLAGADPNAQAKNPSRVRPLHSAVAGPDPMLAETLLAMGAEANAQQEGGYTALHAAAKHGNERLVELLLRSGAAPDIATDDGRTAADFARAEGHSPLAERLA